MQVRHNSITNIPTKKYGCSRSFCALARAVNFALIIVCSESFLNLQCGSLPLSHLIVGFRNDMYDLYAIGLFSYRSVRVARYATPHPLHHVVARAHSLFRKDMASSGLFQVSSSSKRFAFVKLWTQCSNIATYHFPFFSNAYFDARHQ